VHEADLSKKTDIAPEPWTIADDWQLMWLGAVPALHSRLCMSIDQEDQVARETYSKFREAMDGVVDFGKRLVALPQNPTGRADEGFTGRIGRYDEGLRVMGSVAECKEFSTSAMMCSHQPEKRHLHAKTLNSLKILLCPLGRRAGQAGFHWRRALFWLPRG
jgi:hypothetical protein